MAEETTPAAPAEAPQAPESVADTSTNTNQEQSQANSVGLHGFTSEQLADMKKFFDNNGGFDAVKTRISNPEKPAEPAEKPAETQPEQKKEEPTSHTDTKQPEAYQPPKGAITQQEFFAQQYFRNLASEEKYAGIAKEVQDGDYLKTMSSLGIQAFNPDGSINDSRVREFLDIMAKTKPAQPTNTEPDASTAPTVSYTEVGEGGITSLDQAYKILMEANNPAISRAEEYIRNAMNPNSSKNEKK